MIGYTCQISVKLQFNGELQIKDAFLIDHSIIFFSVLSRETSVFSHCCDHSHHPISQPPLLAEAEPELVQYIECSSQVQNYQASNFI